MIRFFRNIRMKFLAEGKLKNYTKYAIGEIFLIMVGILLAFQINTWNEGRKQLKEEIEILKNIREDFVNAIHECEENNGFRKRIINATHAFYSIMYVENDQTSQTTLDSLMADFILNPTYNNQELTLNILFNSGKINIIQNDKIKKALLLWPQEMNDTKEDEVYAYNILYNDAYPIMREYISLPEINRRLKFRNFSLFNYQTKTSFISDYESLFQSMEFEGVLATRELHLALVSVQTEELIKKAKKIIQLINEELTKID